MLLYQRNFTDSDAVRDERSHKYSLSFLSIPRLRFGSVDNTHQPSKFISNENKNHGGTCANVNFAHARVCLFNKFLSKRVSKIRIQMHECVTHNAALYCLFVCKSKRNLFNSSSCRWALCLRESIIFRSSFRSYCLLHNDIDCFSSSLR